MAADTQISMRSRLYITIFVCVITLIVSVTLIVVIQSNKPEEGEARETINNPKEGGGRVFTTRRATTFNVEENTTTGLVNNDITTVTTGTRDAPGATTEALVNMTATSVVPSDGTAMPARSTSTAMPGKTPLFAFECPAYCSIFRKLVCGTDGLTYQSVCVLQLIACYNNDHTLEVASQGACNGTTVIYG